MARNFRYGPIWDFDAVLALPETAQAIGEALDHLGARVPAEVETELRAVDDPNAFSWDAHDEAADLIATRLEERCGEMTTHNSACLHRNAATAIRMRAGGRAKRGKPLDWSRLGATAWIATDNKGTDWVVDGDGQITIAHWDWADLRCSTAEAARRAVEEHAVAPPLPEDVMVEEHLSDE
jgi:hypothetical protein